MEEEKENVVTQTAEEQTEKTEGAVTRNCKCNNCKRKEQNAIKRGNESF